MARPNDVGVGVAVIIVDAAKNYLLLKRQGAHAANTWAVPGGWVDRTDTSLLDVVRREAKEEVNVTVLDAVQVGVTTEDHPDKGFRSVTVYFLCTNWYGPVRIMEPEKCSATMFYPLSCDLTENTFPGLAQGVEFAKKHLDKF